MQAVADLALSLIVGNGWSTVFPFLMPSVRTSSSNAVVPISNNHPLLVEVDVHSPSKDFIFPFDLKMKGSQHGKANLSSEYKDAHNCSVHPPLHLTPSLASTVPNCQATHLQYLRFHQPLDLSFRLITRPLALPITQPSFTPLLLAGSQVMNGHISTHILSFPPILLHLALSLLMAS